MVGELSQVYLVQMALPELVLVVLHAQRVKHQEWAGRVVLPQQ
jgi:hypothetical protein